MALIAIFVLLGFALIACTAYFILTEARPIQYVAPEEK